MLISEKCSRGVPNRRRRRPAGRARHAGPVGKSRINQSRWYDPTVGRWLSEDPAEIGQNLYEYCGNAPTDGIDPSGLAKLWVARSGLWTVTCLSEHACVAVCAVSCSLRCLMPSGGVFGSGVSG